MVITKAYDIEVLPNFFSITIVDIGSYLKMFADCVSEPDKKGKTKPIPMVQKITVKEIKERLSKVEVYKFYITDTDDSQLFPMLSYINNFSPHYNNNNVPVRTDMFGYNSSRYDRLMTAALLMYAGQSNNTKELITRLFDASKKIIQIQNDPELFRSDYFLSNLKRFGLPYKDVDIMTIFALNKCGKGVDKEGKTIYFPKGLKQTSINLQWYQLLEHELPPITEKDAELYWKDLRFKGITAKTLNTLIDKWDRYILPEWIPDTMHYNENDVFIVCEMIRLYIDEIRLRYSTSTNYGVDVLSSSRSDIANVIFTKFYSEFSGLNYKQWGGKKTERTAMSFKRVIVPLIKFKTPELQDLLEDMRKVVVHSISKDSFVREVKLGKLVYTIATGGLHTQDVPRELRSKCKSINSNSYIDSKGNIIWDNLTDDSYVLTHFDISSFYPRLMVNLRIAPAHLNEGIFVKLVEWVMNTRVAAKHSIEDVIDGVPKEILAEVFKIVINSIYGKLGFEYGDLLDKLAVLKVTINGQLLIMMVCEALEMVGIEVASANTDGIVVKLYKKDKAKFDEVVNGWKEETNLKADSEEYEMYINRDINNYFVREFNGKMIYKGALHPLQYAADLTKGYDMPIIATAIVNYFINNKPVLETLYESRNILDFCKTQNVGKQYHVESVEGSVRTELQRYIRFYVGNKGASLEKVNNVAKTKSSLAAGKKSIVINTLDDKGIEFRNINYKYYYEEAMKIINPIKLGISPKTKADKSKGTVSGKKLIQKYGGQFNTLFDDQEEN